MKLKTFLWLLSAAQPLAGCLSDNQTGKTDEHAPITLSKPAKGDSTIYGLVCDGTCDTAIVLLPFTGGDPVSYNVVEARRNKRIVGDMKVGDWAGIIANGLNRRVADMAVDLDQLKGIWCYMVMPRMRAFETMSKRMQAQLSNALPDSIKRTYMIPREYGFWLKRGGVAQSVGYIPAQSSLENESPVVYPPLGFFVSWRIFNGRVIVTGGTPVKARDNSFQIANFVDDTCSIDYLGEDSLVLSDSDGSRSYYRKKSIDDVNVKARRIAQQLSEKALEDSKE